MRHEFGPSPVKGGRFEDEAAAEAEVEVEAEIGVGIELGATASRWAGSSVKGVTPVMGNRDLGAVAVSAGVSTSGPDGA